VLTTSRHGQYFLPSVICWVDGKQKDFVRVFSSIRVFSSVIIHFNDVDHEYFWIWIVGGNEVVERDSVIVDVATALESSQYR